ncbi:hypothetical protein AMS68_001131 [Peltaster fructicola]|uniref:Uncharacterized protein n=1 Tax=Peltaster fructicola TaxID=286661 RepID=A0A6H0XLL2_9PEZI|nr:hypothetical protein AMS68_001131 [Peltaster fructicola]
MTTFSLRPPTFSPAKAPDGFTTPSIQWLTETWHVTHSTLPMWKSKRNVRIQYTPLPPSRESIKELDTDRMNDLVTYQGLKGEKISTIEGIDTAATTETGRGEWDWRGKGLLKIASSHWEILGWGSEGDTANKWVVTMFAKTMFTPAGIDVYSKSSSGLQPQSVAAIKQALAAIEDENVQKMATELFEVQIDDSRKD